MWRERVTDERFNELKERMEHDVPAWDGLAALPHSLTSEVVAEDNR